MTKEIALPDDLIEISAEIKIYREQAGQAVYEIGKRLKHVKDNDLAHGQWESWLKSIDIVPATATRMIQAYDQFGSNPTTSYALPTGKIFEMLSLPESVDREEFVQQPHVIPSTGETKTVDEMTVKELREVKKRLQEAERRANEAEASAMAEQSSARHYEKLWQQAKSQPPRVETKTIEVVPRDYDELRRQAKEAQELNETVVKLTRANNEMKAELTQQQKDDAARKNLQKYLSEQLRAINMNHDSAIFNFVEMQGDPEAVQGVMRFLTQYEAAIRKQFTEWENLISVTNERRDGYVISSSKP